jgi:hypothetical protein
MKSDKISNTKKPKTTGLKIGEPFHSIKNFEKTTKAINKVATSMSVGFEP